MPSELLTAEYVRSILSYEPETGRFWWRWRSDVAKQINTRCAGKEAGTADKDGHIQICIDGKIYFAHRLAVLIVTGKWPNGQIDHWNTRPGDNHYGNLRDATGSQNLCNRGATLRNTSGFKGVSWAPKTQDWRANICVERKQKNLGGFPTPEAAYAAYCEAATRMTS